MARTIMSVPLSKFQSYAPLIFFKFFPKKSCMPHYSVIVWDIFMKVLIDTA